MKNYLVEIVGWYGAGAILGAYLLVSFGYIAATDVLYQILNLTGALGIIMVSLQKRVYQPVVLNIVWVCIALIALGRLFL